jgi:hypothetical protein
VTRHVRPTAQEYTDMVIALKSVSSFCPQPEALALTWEHWYKLSWENRSPSGILFPNLSIAFLIERLTNRWHEEDGHH